LYFGKDFKDGGIQRAIFFPVFYGPAWADGTTLGRLSIELAESHEVGFDGLDHLGRMMYHCWSGMMCFLFFRYQKTIENRKDIFAKILPGNLIGAIRISVWFLFSGR